MGYFYTTKMKLNRTKLFIAITSIALLVVLLIQVNWLLETAKIKEAFFNEKANMVLSRTAEALSADKETCRKIEDVVQMESNSTLSAKLGKNEVHTIDSIFNHYMKFYNFHIDYRFEVAPPGALANKYVNSFTNNVYNKPLVDGVNNNGVELKLIFPDKKQFINAEMGTLFITSVVLILLVLVLFWQTILSLLKEKKISEHTTDFLNNMTHEFKTPLTNIALAGKMMTKEFTIGQQDKIKHYSGIILEENEKLRLQVEQVLSMTALERGEIPLYKTALNFHHLINDTLKSMSIQVEHKNGNLKLNLAAKQFVVMGDKTQLTNAFCNLIDNAIKYSANNPQIFIKTFNTDKNLMVVIADNGIGIEKEYQQKIFDKYFRVPTGDIHNVKGFGLGLAYVKKIIELHGGSIDLHSQKSKDLSAEALAQAGTTITIILPNA